MYVNLQFEEAKLLDFNITIYLQYIMQVRYYNSTNFIIYIDIDKIAILTTTKKYFDQISIILCTYDFSKQYLFCSVDCTVSLHSQLLPIQLASLLSIYIYIQIIIHKIEKLQNTQQPPKHAHRNLNHTYLQEQNFLN